MQSLADDAGRENAAPVRRVIASEGKGIGDLLEVIEGALETRGRRSSRTETWNYRLREMLRDSLLESLAEDAVQLHADRVAAKTEDPYTALTALREELRHAGTGRR